MSPDICQKELAGHKTMSWSIKQNSTFALHSFSTTNSLQDIKSSPSEFIKCCSSIVSLIVQLDYGLLPKVI